MRSKNKREYLDFYSIVSFIRNNRRMIIRISRKKKVKIIHAKLKQNVKQGLNIGRFEILRYDG